MRWPCSCSGMLLAFFPPSLSLVRKTRQMLLHSWISVKLLEKLKDALKVKEASLQLLQLPTTSAYLVPSVLYCLLGFLITCSLLSLRVMISSVDVTDSGGVFFRKTKSCLWGDHPPSRGSLWWQKLLVAVTETLVCFLILEMHIVVHSRFFCCIWSKKRLSWKAWKEQLEEFFPSRYNQGQEIVEAELWFCLHFFLLVN